MPVVPRLGNPIQQSALPTVSAPTAAPIEAFGGGKQEMFKAAGNLQKAATDIMLDEKRKADDAATQEAYFKTVEHRNDLMYNKDSGAINKKGKAAFGVPEEYGDQFDTYTQSIEDELPNEDAKAIYRKIKMQQKSELDGSLMRHANTEFEQFKSDTFKSTIAVTRDDAVKNYQEPGKIESSLGLQEMAIAQWAQDNDIPAAKMIEMQQEASSKTFVGVIERVLAGGDDKLAKQFYDDGIASGKITGKDQESLLKAMNVSSSRADAYRIADDIIANYGSRPAAMAAVKSTEDPETRRMAEDLINKKFDNQNADANRYRDQLYRDAFQMIEQNPGQTFDEAVPPNVQAELEPEKVMQLRSYTNKKISGEEIKTDWAVYSDLRNQATSVATSKAFQDKDLLQYRDSLGNTELKELVKLQDEMKSGKTGLIDAVRTKDQMIVNTLTQFGEKPNPKRSDDKARIALFKRAVDDQERSFIEENGRRPKSAELQKMVDEQLAVVKSEPGWFGTSLGAKKVRAFESNGAIVPKAQPKPLEIRDVPPTDRTKIEDALRKKGLPVNDQQVLYYYNLKAGRGR